MMDTSPEPAQLHIRRTVLRTGFVPFAMPLAMPRWNELDERAFYVHDRQQHLSLTCRKL